MYQDQLKSDVHECVLGLAYSHSNSIKMQFGKIGGDIVDKRICCHRGADDETISVDPFRRAIDFSLVAPKPFQKEKTASGPLSKSGRNSKNALRSAR